MELSKKLNRALNVQMNKEFYSAYSYLAAEAYFTEEELGGFANFFHIQAGEELQHGMKIFQYIHNAGGTTVLEPITAPKRDFKNTIEVFEYGLKNERGLAEEINQLLALSIAERHAPTQVFLQWFITEQVEEEALFTRCIKRLRRVAGETSGLLILDNEFASRQPEAKEKE